jgi:hypothetical protein
VRHQQQQHHQGASGDNKAGQNLISEPRLTLNPDDDELQETLTISEPGKAKTACP